MSSWLYNPHRPPPEPQLLTRRILKHSRLPEPPALYLLGTFGNVWASSNSVGYSWNSEGYSWNSEYLGFSWTAASSRTLQTKLREAEVMRTGHSCLPKPANGKGQRKGEMDTQGNACKWKRSWRYHTLYLPYYKHWYDKSCRSTKKLVLVVFYQLYTKKYMLSVNQMIKSVYLKLIGAFLQQCVCIQALWDLN